MDDDELEGSSGFAVESAIAKGNAEALSAYNLQGLLRMDRAIARERWLYPMRLAWRRLIRILFFWRSHESATRLGPVRQGRTRPWPEN